MCWKTYSDENAEIRTAESDIPVFKVVVADGEGAGRPYYAGVIYPGAFYQDAGKNKLAKSYEKGKTYEPSGFTKPEWYPHRGFYAADEGFHSYSPECKAQFAAQFVDLDPDSGINSCVKVWSPKGLPLDEFTLRNGELALMDCVIPKGARYCVNEQGEYVSDRIRVKGFRKAPKKNVRRLCVRIKLVYSRRILKM